MNEPGRRDARSLIQLVVDSGRWRSWDAAPVDPVDASSRYGRELAAARQRSGYDESVITGEATLRGRRIAVIATELSFLGGSIGVAAAERLTAAVERATTECLPLVAITASGGVRMQEGALAFVQMVKMTSAVVWHRRKLPYVVYFRHPTTGGVLASFASLGHVTLAEPGALVGFMGPRVYEELHGVPFPAGVQVAENLARVGVLDGVVAPEALRETLIATLGVLTESVEGRSPSTRMSHEARSLASPITRSASAWDSVGRSRRTGRPGLAELLNLAAADVTRLNGGGEARSEPPLLLALARFGRARCVVLGYDRRRRESAVGAASLRAARRGMRLAGQLGLPLVTVVDTAGAALSKKDEEDGLASEIARCLAELVSLETSTVSLLLGEGAGGAAIALLPADRVLCSQHAWLAPLAPEAASALMFRTTSRAAEVAECQRICSTDLLHDGIVDRVIPEYPDAADEPQMFCRRVGRLLEAELRVVTAFDPGSRYSGRRFRYRMLGVAEDVGRHASPRPGAPVESPRPGAPVERS